MKQLHALVAAVATAAAIGLAAPAQAATISNFNQNPANGGLTATNGVLTSAGVVVDYTFQVPPNAGITTTGATLMISSANLSTAGTGTLTFTIMGTAGAFAGQTLLSGTLQATTVTVNAGAGSILISGTGSAWSSSAGVTYNVGGGNQTANFLQGQTFSLSLLSLSNITVGGGGLVSFTSQPSGSITGNFAAVPEPASLVLMGLGLAGIPGVVALRRRAAKA